MRLLVGLLAGLLGFLFGARKDEGGDPAVAALARQITRNLEALGLNARMDRHGAFFEIRASTSPKLITEPGSREASGVALLLAPTYEPPQLVFEQINSLGGGLGARMVEAALDGLRAHPGAIARVRVNDLSPVMRDGRRWWVRLAANHADLDWRITHDEDATHRADDVTQSADFIRRRETLHALAAAFGHDPDKVTLRPQKPAFDYIGQNFLSEGESFPDGRVAIYYDPAMTDARMGCCLAHELQHVRYGVVRAAYLAERPDGPLRRRFEKYTPALLAARRGVSAYSNEHWDAWKGDGPPRLFEDELQRGGSEPINETIAEVAKARFNWGDEVRIDPLWKELQQAIDEEYARLTRAAADPPR